MMLRICFLLLALASTGVAADLNWNFGQPPGPGDWRSLHGNPVQIVSSAPPHAKPVLALGADQSMGIRVPIPVGVHELIVQARGTGVLTLSAAGTGFEATRSLRLQSGDFGRYGLLFETQVASDVELRLGVREGDGQIDCASLSGADTAQLERWRTAQESWRRFGYFGVDPQRPAPGRQAQAPVAITPENLKRWAIRERLVLLDPDYDEHWVQDAPAIAGWFGARGFRAATATDLAAWLDARVAADDAVGTSVLLAYGSVPDILFQRPFAQSRLGRYLAAGGRVVAAGNAPFWNAQGVNGPIYEFGEEPRAQWLGLASDRTNFYGMNGAVLAPAGIAWGLEPGLGLSRPVLDAGISAAFVSDSTGRHVGVGLVNLRSDAPLSGLIFVPDMILPGGQLEAHLRNLYRLASYGGTPVQIPDGPPPAFAGATTHDHLLLGNADRRTVWLRRERLQPILRAAAPVAGSAILRLSDARGRMVVQSSTAVSVAAGTAALSDIDLSPLAVGEYRLDLAVDGTRPLRLSRSLRIAPEPDTAGTHVGLWLSATSPRPKRTHDQLRWLAERNLEPLLCDDNDVFRDLALDYGLPWSVRRHVHSEPPGLDIWRRTANGEVARVLALDNQRVAKGYAEPRRRAYEAERFAQLVQNDAPFPSWNGRIVTGDDWSQWFGPDYHQAAKEGFQARYAFPLPAPPGMEDSDDIAKVAPPPPGLVADDHPWLLANRFWSEEVLGDMARRLTAAARAVRSNATVGQISGAMQIPAILITSAMYPSFNNGPRGFSLNSFYYYNTLWQPPLAHYYYQDVARMGARNQEQYVMVDCAYEGRDTAALYTHFGWLCLSGGVTGIQYFRREEMTPGGEEGMRLMGGVSRRHGHLISALRPERAQVAMLVPFEQLVFHPVDSHELAYCYLDLLRAGIDVETLSPEEPAFAALEAYGAVVLPRLSWLKQGTAARLEAYLAGGGTVVCDAVTARHLSLNRAHLLDVELGQGGPDGYGDALRQDRIREAFARWLKPPVTTSTPDLIVRRVAGAGGQALWVTHTLNQTAWRAARANGSSDRFHKGLAADAGFGTRVVAASLEREDDGSVPIDVLGGGVLPVERSQGRMRFTLPVPTWQSRLVLLAPAEPKALQIEVRPQGQPSQAASGKVRWVDAAGRVVAAPFALQLEVAGPDGSVHRGLSRRLLAREGIAEFPLPFATNDPPGTYTVRATDTALGFQASANIATGSPGRTPPPKLH